MSEGGRPAHPKMLHPELNDLNGQGDAKLQHAEGASKNLHSRRQEAQPRGAVIRGNRPVDQSKAAKRFMAAPEHAKIHDERLWDLREKRDRQMHGIPEWEQLRTLASEIKEHALTRLDHYLELFERNALANGIQVHWAKDAAEHNQIVLGITRRHNAKRLIKSKSMLTEECGFRDFMEGEGVEPADPECRHRYDRCQFSGGGERGRGGLHQ
jgi:L-lactate dehydrogenase complex protein LldF